MPQRPGTATVGLASSGDIKAILGTLDDGALLEILALRPTLRDVRDVFGAGEPLMDVVAEIVAVVSSEEDEAGPSH